MNPRERFITTLKHKPADRVPLLLEGLHYATREQVAALTDPARRDIAERVFDELHYRVNHPARINRYLVTPPQFMERSTVESDQGDLITKTIIHTPRGDLHAVSGRNPLSDTAWTIEYPVKTREDLEALASVPWELPAGLDAPKRLPADLEGRGLVATSISSPFVCIAGAMVYERFLELCATDLVWLKELTAQCMERTLDVLDVLLSSGTLEYVWLGGCEWVTPPMASPRLYYELVQEYEQRIIERIHAGSAFVHVHCHGHVRDTIEWVIGRGADFFEPVEPPPDGDITLADAKALVGGRMVLGGNIESRVLENESVEEVERAVRAAFAGGGSGMALRTTACPIGLVTPRMLTNYHRMIDLWEELSPLGLEAG